MLCRILPSGFLQYCFWVRIWIMALTWIRIQVLDLSHSIQILDNCNHVICVDQIKNGKYCQDNLKRNKCKTFENQTYYVIFLVTQAFVHFCLIGKKQIIQDFNINVHSPIFLEYFFYFTGSVLQYSVQLGGDEAAQVCEPKSGSGCESLSGSGSGCISRSLYIGQIHYQ